MIGIKAIASYVPETRVDNLERCTGFGKDTAFIREKLGFLRLPRKACTIDTSDMCKVAFEALAARVSIDLQKVDCILVCTQNPDGYGLPHTAALVHHKLGLPSKAAAFDVGLGCSGFVYSLNLITNFMLGNAMRTGLLFTADPYSKVIDQQDYTTELLFGDAATCTLISNEPVYVPGKAVFGTDGGKHAAIHVDAGSRRLAMDGRDVFNFAMRIVPENIQNCIAQNGLTADTIDLFLLHQASRYIVTNIGRKLNLPADKAPFLAETHGNTVSSSIPLMLERYMCNNLRTILISGFGVGLSWASTILKRVKETY